MIQLQPTRTMCLPTAFAIVMGIPVADLIKDIGHDGSEEVWKDQTYPSSCRGFHPQEIIDCCMKRGFLVMEIESKSILGNPRNPLRVNVFDNPVERLKWWLGFSGVLSGETQHGKRHAVAWVDSKIIDPSGLTSTTIDNFNIEVFFPIFDLNIQK